MVTKASTTTSAGASRPAIQSRRPRSFWSKEDRLREVRYRRPGRREAGRGSFGRLALLEGLIIGGDAFGQFAADLGRADLAVHHLLHRRLQQRGSGRLLEAEIGDHDVGRGG